MEALRTWLVEYAPDYDRGDIVSARLDEIDWSGITESLVGTDATGTRRRVLGQVGRLNTWNVAQGGDLPTLYWELNWPPVQVGRTQEWQRCYFHVSDGRHRLLAAREGKVAAVWIAVLGYAFSPPGSRPPDRAIPCGESEQIEQGDFDRTCKRCELPSDAP